MNDHRQRWSLAAVGLAASILLATEVTGQQALPTAATVTSIAMESNQSNFVIGSQMGLNLCAAHPLQVVSRHESALVHIHDLKLSADQHWLLASGGRPAEEGRVEFWRWPELQVHKSVRLSNDSVMQVAVSPSGRNFAAGDIAGLCHVVSLENTDQRLEFSGHSAAVLAIDFLTEDVVASAGVDQTIRLWNAKDGQVIRSLNNHVDAVTGLAVRRSGTTTLEQLQLISLSQDQTVRRWQPSNGRLIKFCKLSSIPRCVALTKDHAACFVGCDDGVVRKIELESMQLVDELPTDLVRIHALALLEESRRLLVAGTAGVRIIGVP